MQRGIAGIRPVYGLAAAALVILWSLAGCGHASAGGTSGGSAAPGSTGPADPSASQSAPGDALALSHMKILTQLSQAQLCGVLSPAAAVTALGGAVAAPVYSSQANVGINCQWVRKGAAPGANELYVGIPAVIDWAGTRGVDKLLHATSLTVDARPALAIAWQATIGWAQVDVALGGAGDPVAEYRAPTAAGALALAKAATPHVLALG